MNEHEWALRSDLCEIAHRLYLDGFMSGSDGNLSTILSDNEILVTPSRLCKGFLKPEQIVKIDRQGKQLTGDYPSTTEVAMHLAAYEERPDICSVVHCHPPILIAFTVAGLSLPEAILPEIELMSGGKLPLAEYATPGSTALADSIRKNIRDRANSLVMLDHHGILSVGQDISQAAIKVENAESAAKVILYARLLGGVHPLPSDALAKLREARKNIMEMESQIWGGYCHAEGCQQASQIKTTAAAQPDVSGTNQSEAEKIVAEVLKQMQAVK
jgi:L-fuculose-phosphate aldolase